MREYASSRIQRRGHFWILIINEWYWIWFVFKLRLGFQLQDLINYNSLCLYFQQQINRREGRKREKERKRKIYSSIVQIQIYGWCVQLLLHFIAFIIHKSRRHRWVNNNVTTLLLQDCRITWTEWSCHLISFDYSFISHHHSKLTICCRKKIGSV